MAYLEVFLGKRSTNWLLFSLHSFSWTPGNSQSGLCPLTISNTTDSSNKMSILFILHVDKRKYSLQVTWHLGYFVCFSPLGCPNEHPHCDHNHLTSDSLHLTRNRNWWFVSPVLKMSVNSQEFNMFPSFLLSFLFSFPYPFSFQMKHCTDFMLFKHRKSHIKFH